ncbi:MAG: subclass B1 metallo-beta-lactamase [Alphaproteobacteria bacterium]|nr:MAG: subclass B1 metallo-beta-lactamase [Alphaproteobacteria bacterium]
MTFFRTILVALVAVLACATHAFAADSDASEVSLREIADGVWVHTSSQVWAGQRIPANGLVVREGDGLVLVDTAWGGPETTALLARIKAEIGLPVRRAIVTHFHDDSNGGTGVLEEAGIEVWAHPLTVRRAIAAKKPVPDQILALPVDEAAALSLGSAEIYYPGPSHAPDNIMVWLSGPRVLFGGCAVKAADAKGPGNIADADLTGWQVALEKLKHRYKSARIVVPGHGDEGGLPILDHTGHLVRAAAAKQAN